MEGTEQIKTKQCPPPPIIVNKIKYKLELRGIVEKHAGNNKISIRVYINIIHFTLLHRGSIVVLSVNAKERERDSSTVTPQSWRWSLK